FRPRNPGCGALCRGPVDVVACRIDYLGQFGPVAANTLNDPQNIQVSCSPATGPRQSAPQPGFRGRKRLSIDVNAAVSDHGKGVRSSVGVNPDDICILVCNDSGHSDCFPSDHFADRVSVAIGWHQARGEITSGQNCNGSQRSTLDMLLSGHQGGPGGVGPPLSSDNS